MRMTTLCYIKKDGRYLMLHRTKKKQDQSEGKWLGPGGKFEKDETPEECMLREVKEETGLTLTEYKFRGMVTFLSDVWETEYMFLFTSEQFEGELTECDEGEFSWIPEEKMLDLNLWEGDRIFLRKLMQEEPYFSLKLRYEGDRLVESKEF